MRCQFIDLGGILRGRAVHRRHLSGVLRDGIPFAKINNIVDIDDGESDLALGSQAGDFWAVPDPSTLHRVPHTHSSAQMFCDLVAADGSPWATCGRAAVRRVNELVEQELGSVSLGFEQEGYILRKNGGRYEPVVVGRQMQPEILDRLDGFITDLTAALQVMDVPVEKMTAEGGGGMFEVNIPQGTPLEASERWFRCKQVFRIVAGRSHPGPERQVRRIEVRSPDGTCNPYLLAAALLAAGLDGVRRRLDPGPATEYDVAHPGVSGPPAGELPRRLPSNLDAALDWLEADHALRELVGPEPIDAYVKLKRIEWAKFMAHVTGWERRYYAEFF